MTVITISRQYGSGGVAVAARVCELLGYRYFDKKRSQHFPGCNLQPGRLRLDHRRRRDRIVGG